MGIESELLVSIFSRSLVAGTPLLLGTLGEILAERSGVMNIGVEGMMSVGAVCGFGVAFTTGNPWLGLLASIVAGMLLSMLHAFVTISLRANQIVSGLALTTLGIGISGLIGKSFIGLPLKEKFVSVAIPVFSDIPLIGEIFFHRDAVFYLSISIGILLWIMLYKTRWGLVIRSVGENPKASETMGINVAAVRYLCVLGGGGLAGMAGAYLSLAYIPSWIEGMTSGRGWIVIALTIFSLWNPSRAFFGAYLFGGIEVLQFFVQARGIPPQFLKMLPYASTLVALLLVTTNTGFRKVSPPEYLGKPYED